MKSDIEIAQEASSIPIIEVAAGLGLDADDHITPTPAGEGKTTTNVGLSMMTMPGLPKHLAAENMDLVDGRSVGLF